jgi:tRNA-dihydrouridine synthase B
MQVGPYTIPTGLILAPMAGVTDRPFRQLCRRLGAELTVSEMVSSDTALWGTAKTRRRLEHAGEDAPRSVQIVGADPLAMAAAARANVARGAQIIDVNMGCPAKKVCRVHAGSALLRYPTLVGRILQSVAAAVDVPVTLKVRTGWDKAHRNAVQIARIAEDCGIRALAVHGRTRACGFRGDAEYETVGEVSAAVRIPVVANGDIDTPEKARWVLRHTGADGVMIGRAAQGNPWIFREVAHYLATGEVLSPPSLTERRDVLLDHLGELYRFYGEYVGVRVARKHLGWYSRGRSRSAEFRARVNGTESCEAQLDMVREFFSGPESPGAKAA